MYGETPQSDSIELVLADKTQKSSRIQSKSYVADDSQDRMGLSMAEAGKPVVDDAKNDDAIEDGDDDIDDDYADDEVYAEAVGQEDDNIIEDETYSDN